MPRVDGAQSPLQRAQADAAAASQALPRILPAVERRAAAAMISCRTDRAGLTAGTQDAALLEHLRTCDACLDFSVGVDPDNFFRAIGGNNLVPPGGVDAFVGDVMRQAQIRGKETSIAARHTMTWRQRLGIAATLP